MRRRHLPSLAEEGMTMCGHVPFKNRRMKFIKMSDVTCKRCLSIKERMESKELEASEHKPSIKIAVEHSTVK